LLALEKKRGQRTLWRGVKGKGDVSMCLLKKDGGRSFWKKVKRLSSVREAKIRKEDAHEGRKKVLSFLEVRALAKTHLWAKRKGTITTRKKRGG